MSDLTPSKLRDWGWRKYSFGGVDQAAYNTVCDAADAWEMALMELEAHRLAKDEAEARVARLQAQVLEIAQERDEATRKLSGWLASKASGCACVLSEDEETVLEWCQAHAAWLKNSPPQPSSAENPGGNGAGARAADGEPKWCSYCRTDTHNDAQCWCTRPAGWKPNDGALILPPLIFKRGNQHSPPQPTETSRSEAETPSASRAAGGEPNAAEQVSNTGALKAATPAAEPAPAAPHAGPSRGWIIRYKGDVVLHASEAEGWFVEQVIGGANEPE